MTKRELEWLQRERDALYDALKKLRDAEWMMCCDYGDQAVRDSILDEADAALEMASNK